LLYALRIYTRDLKVPIIVSKIPARTEALGEQQTGARLRCAAGAAIVAWFSGELAAPELSVLRCASEEEYRLPLQPAKDPGLAAQTLALKLRGLLTDATPTEPDDDDYSLTAEDLAHAEPRGAQLAGDHALANEKTRGVGQGANSVSVPENDVAGTFEQTHEHVTRDRHMPDFEGGMEWAFGAANAFSGLRQGLLLRLALVSTHLSTHVPLALELDGALVTSVASNTSGYHLTVSEIPIGAALSARLTRSSWTVSCGPRVSFHLVQADGIGPDGRSGSATNVAAGLGALERVLYQASQTVGFALSLSNEAIIPRRRFTLDGQNRLDVGRFQWTLSLGIAVQP
jgi:hypothetical protein